MNGVQEPLQEISNNPQTTKRRRTEFDQDITPATLPLSQGNGFLCLSPHAAIYQSTQWNNEDTIFTPLPSQCMIRICAYDEITFAEQAAYHTAASDGTYSGAAHGYAIQMWRYKDECLTVCKTLLILDHKMYSKIRDALLRS